jgi:hypothetical protein
MAVSLPHVDVDAVRDAVRDLSRDLDVSRLEVPRLSVIRDELARLELPSADDVRRELERFERDLPDVGRLLHRPAKSTPWLQAPSTAIMLGAVALVAGVVAGGILAWLYQPERGVQRRKALRRRMHKFQRKVQHQL